MSEESKIKLKEQTDLADKNLDKILETLALDAILNAFDSKVLGLLDFMDKNLLSRRQIAKKILSYNTNPQLTDRELNLMLWGQDLSANEIYIFIDGEYIKQPNPGYTPYMTETEDMVYYGSDYEPMDIRQMIKDTINNLIEDVRKEIKSIEHGISQMIDKLPKAITQAITSITAALSPQVMVPPAPMIVTNPLGAAQLSLTLHNTSHLLNNILKDILLAIKTLTSVNQLTTGVIGSIANAVVASPKIIKPSINGAPAIKIPVKVSVPPIPKIHFLLPDELLIGLYSIVNPILEVLNVFAEIIVGLDAAALALDLVALGPANAVLLGLQQTMKTALSQITSLISMAASAAASGNNAPKASGTFGNSINDASSSATQLKQAQDKYASDLEIYKSRNNQTSYDAFVPTPTDANSDTKKKQWNSYIQNLHDTVTSDVDNINALSLKLPGGKASMSTSDIPNPYTL